MARRAGRRARRVHRRARRAGLPRALPGRPLGSTTHISVLDADGRACSVTCTNGEGSGSSCPAPASTSTTSWARRTSTRSASSRYPPGRRMPSMMAPTVVLGDGEVELVLGSAGSNRIRSAILQTIVGVVDHGSAPAPRSTLRACTSRTASSSPSPASMWRRSSRPAARRRLPRAATCSSVACRRSSATRDGRLSGAGDPRRGGGRWRHETGWPALAPLWQRWPRLPRSRRRPRPVADHARRLDPGRPPVAAGHRRRPRDATASRWSRSRAAADQRARPRPDLDKPRAKRHLAPRGAAGTASSPTP